MSFNKVGSAKDNGKVSIEWVEDYGQRYMAVLQTSVNRIVCGYGPTKAAARRDAFATAKKLRIRIRPRGVRR